jgi:membrane associated rhomboid family serine protease
MHRDLKTERKRMLYSAAFPLFMLFLMFTVRLIESLEGANWYFLGVKPLSLQGLPGIITAPFIHADWGHFGANAGPFFVLGSVLFYVYRDIAFKVFIWIYLLAGIWLWFGARDAWHVGASGLVYGMAAFLFLSGIIRNYVPLIAVSLLVIFLYGGLFWGLFPVAWLVEYSWEAHLWGALAGIVVAVVFRKEGPQKPPPARDDENEAEEGDDRISYWHIDTTK